MKDRETTTSISLVAIRKKDTEFATLMRRANGAFDILFDNEEDEGTMADDEAAKEDFDAQVHSAAGMLHDMGSLKRGALLTQTMERELQQIEDHMAEDETRNHAAGLPSIQAQMKELSNLLVESTIPPAEELWGVRDTLKERLLKIQTSLKAADATATTTIIKSEYNRDFDVPKANIPKFKGSLEEWHGF